MYAQEYIGPHVCLFVCMYNMYIHIYVRIMHIYMYISISMYVQCICTYVHMRECKYLHTFIYFIIYQYVCMCDVHLYVYLYLCIYDACVYIYIHA